MFIPGFDAGKDLAIDLTVQHGWRIGERRTPAALAARPEATREHWRRFLVRAEEDKHATYDAPCSAEGWSFKAMAFGTWGGMGPEAAKLLQRFVARASDWREADTREARREEIRLTFGLAQVRGVLHMLDAVRLLM